MRRKADPYRARAKRAVQRSWRRTLHFASRDCTEVVTKRSCLVVAAHPDDETFGCGATIARKASAGTAVAVLIATDGRNANPSSRELTPEQLGAIRREEALRACEILGVPADRVIQVGVPHLRSPEGVERVTSELVTLLERFAPAEILVNTALDYHPDHKILNGIVRRVTAERGYQGWLGEYPVWYLYDGPWEPGADALSRRPTTGAESSTPRGKVGGALYRLCEPGLSVLRLRPRKVLSGPFLDRKREAVQAHRSQVSNFTGEEQWGYLGQEFVELFLQADEIFFPVRERHGGRPEPHVG